MNRDELRARELAALPRWYQPWAHLLGPTAFGVAGMAWALATLGPVGVELLVIPAAWVLANAAEWRIHRDLLHKRHPLIPWLYDRHTLMHHRVYVEDDMAIRSSREFGLVLIPPVAEVLLVVAASLPPLALMALGYPDAGRLWLLTNVGYVLSYEWLHLLWHVPPHTWLGSRPVVRRLARLHASHHHPKRMMRANFNVTLPMWDAVRGTWDRA
jgi:sterol desaturase/sphingolipid hydroxylase (fatty acid hydroxylase superfamily)